jgi:hypothetical protein
MCEKQVGCAFSVAIFGDFLFFIGFHIGLCQLCLFSVLFVYFSHIRLIKYGHWEQFETLSLVSGLELGHRSLLGHFDQRFRRSNLEGVGFKRTVLTAKTSCTPRPPRKNMRPDPASCFQKNDLVMTYHPSFP